MTGASFSSLLHVDRIQDDHAYRLIQEIHDLPPIFDVMVRRPVRLERLLAPVSLEQMERATSVAFLVEVVPLAPRFRSRPLDHPCEQRAEVARSPLARTERSEDGHRAVGHVHLHGVTRLLRVSLASRPRAFAWFGCLRPLPSVPTTTTSFP